MSDEPEVSAAAAFARPHKRITLPDPAPDGTPLVVEIARPSEHDALMAMAAFPPFPAPPPKPRKGAPEPTNQQVALDMAKSIEAQREANRKIAEVGIVAPAFAFEAPEAGKAYWGDLTNVNQTFIADQIMALTPLFDRLSKAAEEAARVGRFPGKPGGLEAGARPVPGAAAHGAFDPAVAGARRTARRGGGKAGANGSGRGAAVPRG